MVFTESQIKILNFIYLNGYNLNQVMNEIKVSEYVVKQSLLKFKRYNLIDTNEKIPDTLLSKYLKNIFLKKINLDFLKKNNFKILLILLNQEKTIKELLLDLDIKKTQVYNSIKRLKELSIVIENNNKYSINNKLWSDLIEFLILYKTTMEFLNTELPKDSKVLFASDNKIIFENKNDLDRFQKTGFSAFDFSFFYNTNLYTTQENKLSEEEIYVDALNVSKSQRELLLCSIYYLKHNFRNIKNTKHNRIVSILKENKKFKGYPTKEDILLKQENGN